MASENVNFDREQPETSGEMAGVEDEVEAQVGIRHIFRQLRRDPTALLGFVMIAFMTFVGLFAFVDAVVLGFLEQFTVFSSMGVEEYWFAKNFWVHPERDPGRVETLLPPAGLENTYGEGTWKHPLGTDHRGRDLLVRMFYGTRIAIQVGFLSTVIGLVGGTLVGAVAGYYGGWIDDALMRIVETLYAIPFLILVIAFMAAFGRNIVFAMIGVGIVSIPTFSRLIRSRVVSVREESYVEAARAAGVRDRNIILRHVIPNSFAPVLVQATLQIGVAILTVAGLSFLGFGAQPPTPSWGQMLSQSKGVMLTNPWFSIWPGLAILLTVVGFNVVGDGLRDALDPKLDN